MKTPAFYNRNDPDAYLECEKNVKLIFYCYKYSEVVNVKLIVFSSLIIL
jgi:hypothetical protein